LAAIAVAVLAAVGSLIWCFTLTGKLSTAQAELADAKQQDTQLAAEFARDQCPPEGGHR
jgi:hypothetical protein